MDFFRSLLFSVSNFLFVFVYVCFLKMTSISYGSTLKHECTKFRYLGVMLLEVDQCIGIPIHISQYDDVSYQQNSAAEISAIFAHKSVVCKQTRLHATVLVGCFIKVSLGQAALHSACIKNAYVTASSDPGLHRIRCCMVLHHSEVMVLMCRALFFTYQIWA